MSNRVSATFSNFAETMGLKREKKMTEAEYKSKQAEKEAVAMDTFKTRITSYRNTFNPYQRYAPGFDYINWKPYGAYRYEDPNLVYTSTCRALAPYVRDVVTAACIGVQERQWEAMTTEGQLRIQERTSRGPSRIGSRVASRDNVMHED